MSGERPEGRRPHTMTRRLGTDEGGGPQVVRQRRRRAGIDERRPLRRRALGVERVPGCRRIVDQRDGRIELRLADPHERHPLLHRLGVESVPAEAHQDVGDGRRFQDHLVAVGRELDGACAGAGLRCGTISEHAAVEIGEPVGGGPRRAVGIGGPRDAVEGDLGRFGRDGLPGRVGQGAAAVDAAAVPGRLELADRLDEGGDDARHAAAL